MVDLDEDLEYYSDDPIEEFEGPRFNGATKLVATALLGAIGFLGFAAAGRINLNSGQAMEFGQGMTASTACDGNLSITPQNIVQADATTYYVDTITVSNIDPTACDQKYFSIKLYDSSTATPQNLYASNGVNYNELAVYINGGKFAPVLGGLQDVDIVKNSSSSFSAVFKSSTGSPARTPLAASRNIEKLSIESKYQVFSGSMYFDGTEKAVAYNSNSTFNFGSGNFTVEWFQKFDNNPSLITNGGFFDIGGDCNQPGGLALIPQNGSLILRVNGIGSDSSVAFSSAIPSFSASTWYHFAIVRNGNVVKAYINGTETNSVAYAGSLSGQSPVIGALASYATSTNWFGAGSGNPYYISNFKITKSARYTSTFTAPLVPLNTINDPILLLLSKTNTTTTTDSSASGVTPNSTYTAPDFNSAHP